MRILQVTDLFEPFIGGLEKHVKALSQGLTQRGHEVTVATAHLPGTTLDEVIDGVRVRRIAGWSARALARWYDRAEAPFHPPVPDPGVLAALKRIIEDLRPDVVHAQGWITYSCLAIARNERSPLVVTLHDNSLACARKTFMRNGREVCSGPRLDNCLRCAPGQYGVAKGTALTVGLRAARPLHSRVESWVAISRSVANSSRCVVPPDKEISIIPPCSEHTLSSSGQRPAWLPADGYALFVGALSSYKGVNWLLDAYVDAGVKRPLVMIGTTQRDTPRSWPSGVVAKRDVPHEEVMQAWSRAGIGLVPSLCPEGFGLVAVEAMRSGTPVVASRIGALPEVVADGVTGILVTPGNTSELQTAIRRLDEDSELRNKMGAAGLVEAEKFSAEVVTRLYEEHYRRLLDS